MLYRVIGPMGSGKREYVFSLAENAYREGKRVFYLVPEQVSAEVERALAKRLGAGFSTLVEVSNFSRLSNVVLRSFGRLAVRSITEEEKKLLLLQVLKEARPSLKTLSPRLDPDSVDAFYRELEEARLAGLEAEAVRDLSEKEELPEALREKCRALYVISASLRSKMEGRFDDPGEEQLRLARILQEYDFFRDSVVILDGFWDFTAPQEALIRAMLRQAESLAVTFTAKKGETTLFEKPLFAARRILRFAREADVEVRDVVTEGGEGTEAIRFLQEHLAEGAFVFDGKPEGISLTACPTAADQAHYVADTIRTLVHGGARWRDFAVLFRGEENSEMLTLTLQEEGIPVFCEEREDLASSPLAKTLLLAVRIASLYPKEEWIREYLSRGKFLCDEKKRFLLEKYVATWSISGRSILDGEAFTMNPDGYFSFTSASEAELNLVNEGKKTVFDPLRSLSFALAGGTNEEKITALVAFLTRIGTEKLLFSEIKRDREQGAFDRAGKKVRMWNCVLERLSGIARTCGGEVSDSEEFLSLLSLALSGNLPGEIPPGQDRVHLGLLGFARPEDAKYVFLVDLNAGVFPAVPPKGRYLSEEERSLLCEYGFPLSTGDRAQNEELFLFYLAAAFAKKGLFLSYLTGEDGQGGRSTLSVFGKRVKTLFPHLKERVYRKAFAMPLTEEAAFRYVISHGDSPLSEALLPRLSEKKELRDRLLLALSGKSFRGEEGALEAVLPYQGRDISMTYSRLETYSKCRYSFFARYLLGAKAQGKAEFAANITGSFVHRVLEKALVVLRSRAQSIGSLSSEELKDLCEAVCDEALAELIPEGGALPARIQMQVRQIRKSCLMILRNLQKEFAVSQFEPIFFEKELEDLGGEYRIPLSDGTGLCLYGTIDRVDRYVSPKGEEYVRVVDYKTGSQSFRLEDVANGMDLQMLLYLFALWGRRLEGDGAKPVLPAGILYVSGMGGSVSCENREDLKKVEESPFFGLHREGLLVEDPALLAAQDPDGQGEWIPVAWNRKTPTGKKALVSMENLGRLRRRVEESFARLAEELKAGRIEANPIHSVSRKLDPCAYCDYLTVCKRSPSARRAYRTGLKPEDIFGKEE